MPFVLRRTNLGAPSIEISTQGFARKRESRRKARLCKASNSGSVPSALRSCTHWFSHHKRAVGLPFAPRRDAKFCWRPALRCGIRSAALACGLAVPAAPALAQATIKVGVLHSLSGTMAISETVLKDVTLMAIEEINAKGGVLGKQLEAVVVDPASNWPLFAEKARQLLTQDKVAVVFGCWTSVSRKSVLPVFEELNGLLFYPVQYEGEELSKNVFYTGAAPNQQAIPAVEYL